MKKTKKWFAVLFIGTILFFMGTVLIRLFAGQVMVKGMGIHNALTDFVFFDIDAFHAREQEEVKSEEIQIDWKSLYPFPAEENEQEEAAGAEPGGAVSETPKISPRSIVDQIAGTVKGAEKEISYYTADYLIWYPAMVELSKRYETVMKWNFTPYSEYNGIVEVDGYYSGVCRRADQSVISDRLTELSEYCESLGSCFFYLNAPIKFCRNDADICGVLDFSNENEDDLLSRLSERGVEYLDIRESIHEQGYDHHQMYFKTDHHWLPETGLWAAREIVQKLNRACGFNFELSGIQDDDINKTVYPKHFLGSQGKKVTLAKAEPEDISLLYPDYDTEFHYEIMNLGVNTEGDFSIFYDMHYMEEPDYYKGHPFAAYIYGNQPLEQIENRRLDNGKRLLVIHDSYALPVIPFLALKAQYVDAIDPRYFDGSLRTYIERTKPDAVIVLYNAAELANPAMYNFK